MPNEIAYSLQDLADLADVTPRTIRYYIAQGLLPSPEGAGPAARYAEGHLGRLRLIRQLQREHLPLAEIRARLTGLDDVTVQALLTPGDVAGPAESAIDYIRSVLRGSTPSAAAGPMALTPARHGAVVMPALLAEELPASAEPAPPPQAMAPSPSTAPAPAPVQTPDRSQWDRVTLAPDIELHVRRPLSRLQNKRVDRLIVLARQLLEEE